MKILYLGTGAADWVAKDDYENPEYRRNSSALINRELLIDPGPCVPEALDTFGVDKSAIKYVIKTHDHYDHYNEDTLKMLTDGGAEFYDLSAGGVFNIGGYEVTALKGNHTFPVVHFIISDGEKKLFYGLDGAWLMYEEYSTIKRMGIDYAVFDATVGFSSGDFRIFEHNDLNMVIEMKHTLARHIKRFAISHMAKGLHTGHAELAAAMAEHSVEVAKDGVEVEI